MATKKTSLRAVAPGEQPEQPAKPEPKKPTTISTAVDMSERDLLVALRAKAATEIDSSPPAHTLPRLMQQLRDLDKEIRAIDARAEEHEEGPVDVDSGSDSEAFDPARMLGRGG